MPSCFDVGSEVDRALAVSSHVARKEMMIAVATTVGLVQAVLQGRSKYGGALVLVPLLKPLGFTTKMTLRLGEYEGWQSTMACTIHNSTRTKGRLCTGTLVRVP